MFLIGELKDQAMASEILEELKQRGIDAKLHYFSEQELYQLWLENDTNLVLATDLFRLKMGIAKPLEIEPEWIKIKTVPRGDLTYALVIVCVVIYALSFSNLGTFLYRFLMIGEVESGLFGEIKRGQLWRFFTPALLHMSFLHILFNMLWFKDLGYLIEFNFGKRFLIFFILVASFFSNLMQYFVNGPEFGGMSGVLYGMLGFIWANKAIDPDFPYSLPRRDVNMMIVWYFLCLTGIFGPIANTAHGIGLVVGLLVAVFRRFQWNRVRLKYLLVAIFFFIFTLLVEGYKLDGRYFILINGL